MIGVDVEGFLVSTGIDPRPLPPLLARRSSSRLPPFVTAAASLDLTSIVSSGHPAVLCYLFWLITMEAPPGNLMALFGCGALLFRGAGSNLMALFAHPGSNLIPVALLIVFEQADFVNSSSKYRVYHFPGFDVVLCDPETVWTNCVDRIAKFQFQLFSFYSGYPSFRQCDS